MTTRSHINTKQYCVKNNGFVWEQDLVRSIITFLLLDNDQNRYEKTKKLLQKQYATVSKASYTLAHDKAILKC